MRDMQNVVAKSGLNLCKYITTCQYGMKNKTKQRARHTGKINVKISLYLDRKEKLMMIF